MDHGPGNDQPLSPSDPHAELCRFNPRETEHLDGENRSILDLENIVLTREIIDRQRDTQSREIECVAAGITLDGEWAEAVVKIGFTGRPIVITACLR